MDIELVIFDCDGVLVDSETISNRVLARASLELTGLADLFARDALFSAHSVARGKPHPDLFLSAAAAIGVAPARCVVVEDSASGVTAAVRAGMPALGYVADADERALRAAGAQTLRSLSELPARLGLD